MTEVLTVLIVEDAEDDALLIVEILRGDGLEVAWERVQTAADLSHMLSTRRWDAIISDYNLPGFDAPTALAIMREQGLDVPFIVVSGILSEQQAVALMKVGAQNYIMKDNLVRLPEIMRRELREAQNRRDRQRVEQALQLSEARFQKLVETQPGTLFTAVLRVNGDRALTYLSSNGASLFEVPVAIALADFSAIAALLHPEDRARADAAMAHSAATLAPVHQEWRMVTPSGKIKWVQVHSQPERLPNSDVQWFGVVLEITDRKQAELTVTRQRDLNRLMIEVTQRFVEARAAQFDTEVTRALEQIGTYIQADHGHVVALTAADTQPGGTMQITHRWQRPDCTTVRQPPDVIPTAAFPWAIALLLRREVVNVPQVGALPVDYATDRTSWQSFDVGSVLSVPLIHKTRVVGYVGFLTQGRSAVWDDSIQQMVQVLAQTIASAQERLLAERLLAKREAQSWAILSVMPDLLIRMGADGRYREVLSQNHPLDVVVPSRSRIGRHVSEMLPADLAELKLQAIRQALATHEVQTYEQQIPVGDRLQQEELRAVQCGDDEVLFLIRDISERKRDEAERQRTELALQQSEAQQRALLKALPDLLVRLSKDGIYLEFAASPTFHVIGPLLDLVGTHVTESLPPVVAQQRVDAIKQALATKAIQFYEQDLSTAEKFQIEEVRVVPYRDDEVLALVRDISDRKQSERQLKELNQSLERQVAERTAALEEREARYRGLMEGASDAIVVADMKGHILEVNRRAEELFGHCRDQLTQMHQSQLHPPDHQAELIVLFQESIDTPYFQALNIPILHANGRHIPVDITSTTITLGTTRVVQGIFRDVSDRQRIEAENQRLRDRLGFLLGSSPAVIYSVEPTGNYRPTFISQNMANILGYESEAFIANFTDWREYYHPDEADSIWVGLSAVVERGCYTMEYRFRHRDGHYLWVQDEARVAYDIYGEPQEVIGYLANITDRKCAEERLRQTNAELLRATRLKDEFLANMSHELRTPLNAILGMTEGLQEQVFGAINERQLKALTIVETSASHLLALINDILDMAKIESGQITLHMAPTAIAPLCHSSLTFVQQQAHKKRIQLMDCILPNLPDLVIDERRVRQILINLLANAVKFTSEGGRVSLTVAPELCQDGNAIQTVMRFTVKDTGIGIAPDNQQRLFQPFVQIDSALNRQYAGTGLGLTLVKQFTELHGGQVGLISEVGVGSSFTIDLPYEPGAGRWTASPTPTITSTPEAPAIPDENPLILLASDQEAMISSVVSYLTAKGYRLLVARQGEAAIALAQAENPDLIVMDMQLPEVDGLEAIRRIRDEPHLADCPIIALAALASASARERCLAAGANQHMSRPLKLKQLATAIQHLLTPALHPPHNPPEDLCHPPLS
ncbi:MULTISPECIES: PAS domain S-box protein [Cyanophyceae]|uniref:PAS domain S-box protein n=1 Tax=Cyanophyceae TaxID=3028117 RepID=UPI0016899173|nr:MULTISPECIES: PAS domain S-box protein [Cyanophyceae]MBD1914590.1 PAS domain S-box protein [Phormidium sp. FACHB-77]MBD2030314.1 PAS domain S-box protein [Phormidium sp. FACHB-322]MBD2049860.1 PAS domain S-box protein [Leptolyngbya sp. FACHB-60]